jgi:Fe-S-cluster containining protein
MQRMMGSGISNVTEENYVEWLTAEAKAAGKSTFHFKDFKCRGCGDCCTVSMLIDATMVDLFRIVNYFGISPMTAFRRYFEIKNMKTADGKLPALFIKKLQGACVFYRDQKCSVYPVRPLTCELYPLFNLHISCPNHLMVNHGLQLHCSMLDCDGDELFIHDISKAIDARIHGDTTIFNLKAMKGTFNDFNFEKCLEMCEMAADDPETRRYYIQKLLTEHEKLWPVVDGYRSMGLSIAAVARLIGVNRRTLYRRMVARANAVSK